MAIETAIVLPVLATLALGAFDASRILSRQQQLQSAANEAAEVVLAASSGPGINSSDLKTILVNSLGIQPSQLTIEQRFRCDASPTLVTTKPTSETCAPPMPIYTYVRLNLTETYNPVWTQFGVGSPVNYNIVRTVQTS
ncbi:TadE family protein [Tsuneonella deserti]|nr:TadE family protein [Tsuneonella deserti]